MVKKLFTYIFIYTLLVGCDIQDPISSNDICESDCFLDIEAPSLQMDENGYYHIELLEGYNQTFSTLDANTGSTFLIQKVYWGSDKGIMYGGEPVSCVNPASYTDNGAEFLWNFNFLASLRITTINDKPFDNTDQHSRSFIGFGRHP